MVNKEPNNDVAIAQLPHLSVILILLALCPTKSPSLLSVPKPIIMIAVIPNTINIVHSHAKNNLDLETLFNSILISDNIDFFLQKILLILMTLFKKHLTYLWYVKFEKQTY